MTAPDGISSVKSRRCFDPLVFGPIFNKKSLLGEATPSRGRRVRRSPSFFCRTIGLAPPSGAGLRAGTQRTHKKTATNSRSVFDIATLLRPPIIRKAFDGGPSELRSFRVGCRQSGSYFKAQRKPVTRSAGLEELADIKPESRQEPIGSSPNAEGEMSRPDAVSLRRVAIW